MLKKKLSVLVVMAMIFAMVFGACGDLGDLDISGLLGGGDPDITGLSDLPGENPDGQESNPDYPDGVEPGPGIYEVGDEGPRGGIIFYAPDEGFTVEGYGNPGDPGYFATYTAYYLEAAPNNTGQRRWGTLGVDIGGTETAIGTGRKNTAIIHAHSDGTPAASACVTLDTGDRTDWFLPSRYELIELCKYWYDNGKPADLNFTTGLFWSSSQYSESEAYSQSISTYGDYSDDEAGTNSKAMTIVNIRAIRAFQALEPRNCPALKN